MIEKLKGTHPFIFTKGREKKGTLTE